MTYFPQEREPSVSSALRRFTSVFGKGTGGTTSLQSPGGLIKNLLFINLLRQRLQICKESLFENQFSFKDANINSESGQALDH
jgi:hypothetical protein